MRLNKIIIAALALAASASAFAQNPSGASKEAYWTDKDGNLVRSGYGLCWRAGYWKPELAIKECDPQLFTAAPMAVVENRIERLPTPALQQAPVSHANRALAHFAFDSARLTLDGKAAIQSIAEDAKAARLVEIRGHTDRIGAEAYNERLGMRRAQAAASALQEVGVDPAKMNLSSAGEREPVTARNDCRGQRGSALKSCLAPDRRVEVNTRD